MMRLQALLCGEEEPFRAWRNAGFRAGDGSYELKDVYETAFGVYIIGNQYAG
jgi:hypothetical protein